MPFPKKSSKKSSEPKPAAPKTVETPKTEEKKK
jgi:hypothetical protein